MAFTLYDATIVAAKDTLASLERILKKAEEHPNAASFPQARLYEDMKPLTFQIHTVTRFTELLVARLTGREAAELQDNLTSYEDMHKRIADAQEALNAADKETVNRVGEEVAATTLPSFGTMDMAGKAFAMGVAVPNINFHLTTAYGILRNQGVPLSKRDYIVGFVEEHIMKMP